MADKASYRGPEVHSSGRTLTRCSQLGSVVLIMAGFVASLVVAGCGAGPAPQGFGEGHIDIAVGSSADGGGQLVVDYDIVEAIQLFFNTCLGGSGPDCTGGVVLFSGEDPGFAPIEDAEPAEGIFPLAEGTPVSIELTSKDAETSLFIGGSALNDTGDSTELGTAIEGLHIHGEWRLVLPGGQAPADEYFLGFKMTTTSPAYTESDPFGVMLEVSPE